MKPHRLLLGVAAALIIGLLALAGVAQSSLSAFDSAGEAPIAYANHGPAPELEGLDGWINGEPRTIESLQGRVVLLDFWTYDCVNCIRTIPRLRRWHQEFGEQGLVVIGVHSPEFAYERDPGNVATAVRRLGITYPVALDTRHTVWNAYEIQFWPSIVLVDRSGQVVLRHYGEADYDQIKHVIEEALARPALDP